MDKKKWILGGIVLSVLATINLGFAQNSNIGDVSVNFCNSGNNTKALNMVLDSGKEGEICMEFSNFSENDVNISYDFVDGVTTADKYKSKACKNEGNDTKFGQYVRQDVSKINISSMSKVIQKSYIKFPTGLTGMVNGCLTYSVSDAKDTTTVDSAMFDVLVRKASFIDVLVGGKLSRNLKLSNESKSINTYYDKEKKSLILEVELDNNGNVNESVKIEGSISNIFGYSSLFSGEAVKVLSDSNDVLKMEINFIPWYKGPFKVELNIVGNPQFNFNAASVSDNMKGPISINAETNLFLMPWLLIYILLGLIVFIILIKTFSKHLKFQ